MMIAVGRPYLKLDVPRPGHASLIPSHPVIRARKRYQTVLPSIAYLPSSVIKMQLTKALWAVGFAAVAIAQDSDSCDPQNDSYDQASSLDLNND